MRFILFLCFASLVAAGKLEKDVEAKMGLPPTAALGHLNDSIKVLANFNKNCGVSSDCAELKAPCLDATTSHSNSYFDVVKGLVDKYIELLHAFEANDIYTLCKVPSLPVVCKGNVCSRKIPTTDYPPTH